MIFFVISGLQRGKTCLMDLAEVEALVESLKRGEIDLTIFFEPTSKDLLERGDK